MLGLNGLRAFEKESNLKEYRVKRAIAQFFLKDTGSIFFLLGTTPFYKGGKTGFTTLSSHEDVLLPLI